MSQGQRRVRTTRHGRVKGEAVNGSELRNSLDCLYEVSLALASWVDAATTLSRLFEILKPLIEVRVAVLIQLREVDREFVWHAPGIREPERSETIAKAGSYLTYLSGRGSDSNVALERSYFDEQIYVNAEPDRFDMPLRPSAGTLVRLPLVIGRDAIFGLLQLDCEALDESAVTLLHAIGNQLAVTLDRTFQLEQKYLHVQSEQMAWAEAREIEAQRVSEAGFRLLAESLPHMVWAALPDGGPIYVNTRWIEYTGLSLDESRGKDWCIKAFHPDDRVKMHAMWQAAVQSEEIFEVEHRIQGRDGLFRWHLSRALPELDGSGRIQRWVGTSTDINDRKQLEAELTEARMAAESANQAKTLFLANMSHEIRTPLSVILGFADLGLVKDKTEIERIEALEIIKRNSEQLAELVSELLDLSKVEAGRLEIEQESVELSSLLEDVTSLLYRKAQEKGISLVVESSETIPETLTTDSMRLRQCLVNIIGNAVKFTSKGGVNVAIRVVPSTRGRLLEFTVKDTGVGLTKEQQSRLFKPFSQADPSTSRRFGGTGLGLALARNLARALGGDLFLSESSLGQGSVFVLRIAIGAEDSATRPVFHKLPKDEAARLNDLSILLVEDAPDIQLLVKTYLERAGARVAVAADGKEGVECALNGSFDLILMDIQMPGMDGYEATAQLRRLGYRPPIIALTANAMRGERDRSLQYGFTDYISKPVKRDALLGLIRFTAERERQKHPH